jgi:hypothetical protein
MRVVALISWIVTALAGATLFSNPTAVDPRAAIDRPPARPPPSSARRGWR